MTDFAKLWNSQIPADAKASVIAGITEAAVNNYLAGHRLYDKHRYLVSREFKAAGVTQFALTVIVGGDQAAHTNNAARPLTVRFPAAGPAPEQAGFEAVYQYPAYHGTYSEDQLAALAPNIVVSARDVALYTSWKNTAGGTWSHEMKGISFDLEAKLDLVEDDDRFSLRMVPVKLHVSQTSLAEIRQGIIDIVSEEGARALPAGVDPKISDLFMAIIQLAASTVGPNLAQNIQIPVMETGKFKAYPTAFALSDGVATMAAHLDVSAHVREASEQLMALETGFMTALSADVRAAGGLERLVYSAKVLAAADKLEEPARVEFLLRQEILGEDEILANMTRLNRYAERELTRLRTDLEDLRPVEPTAPRARLAAGADGLAVAINQDTLTRLVSDIGGTYKSGFTDRETLVAIRGRLGYELRLGTPEVDITPANQLKGSVDVDVFAGLYYQVKEILKCSWKWGDEHKVGLGIKGDPKLLITTRKSAGLSIEARLDLGGLKVNAGMGGLLGKIVAALASPFVKLVELVLNGLLKLLQFVVVPVEFRIPEQNTAIRLSRFDTERYERHGSGTPVNKFLLIKTEVTAAKV